MPFRLKETAKLSHQALLNEIQQARTTSEPLEAVRLRGYMAETNSRTRALLFCLFTDPTVWKLAKNIPSSEKTDFLLGELRMALIVGHAGRFKPALDRGGALIQITPWLLRLFEETAGSKDSKGPSESSRNARALIEVLEDAARSGDETLRALIVTAVLEHVLCTGAAVEEFSYWRKDAVLAPMLKEGLLLSGAS